MLDGSLKWDLNSGKIRRLNVKNVVRGKWKESFTEKNNAKLELEVTRKKRDEKREKRPRIDDGQYVFSSLFAWIDRSNVVEYFIICNICIYTICPSDYLYLSIYILLLC
jgi:hypothetical protein